MNVINAEKVHINKEGGFMKNETKIIKAIDKFYYEFYDCNFNVKQIIARAALEYLNEKYNLNLADNTLLHDFFCDELNKKMGEK
jgi:hypothetical protein